MISPIRLVALALFAAAPLPAATLPAGGAAEPSYPRVVVLGIDGMDPEILAETVERYPERMPNFRWLIAQQGIHSLGTSTPPQSPVAWSNFITGRDPGGHGIYDFIHRSPVTRSPAPSAVTEGDDPLHVGLWGDWELKVPLPWHDAPEDNRSGDAFWSLLADAGVPADVWRMPANIPVVPAKGLSFSGMLTPALDSAYGKFTFYTTDPPADLDVSNGNLINVTEFDGVIDSYITGPPDEYKKGSPVVRAPLVFLIDREANAVVLDSGHDTLVLQPGGWSDFVTLTFKAGPMGMSTTTGLARFYLRSIDPEFELYASAINIDPVAPKPINVAEPSSASADLADRRRGIGPYYTQGMAEEVDALKAEVFSDQEFVAQTQLVLDERMRMMDYALDRYVENDEGGLLFFYYSTVDLNCHMLWRHTDPDHPARDPEVAAQDTSHWTGREGSTFADAIYDLYLKMDPVLGRIRERMGDDVTLIVMSDHGFAPWHREFSLNTWLLEKGYLVLREGYEKELPRDDQEYRKVSIDGLDRARDADGEPTGDPFTVVDWSKTRAYGVGFNGLYLNLAGREGDIPDTDEDESGIVAPGAEAEALLAELKRELEAVVDPQTGRRVVLRADLSTDVYHGERVPEAPDIVVGYDSGYGNSDASTLGRIPHDVLADNTGGTFNGNHLMAPDVVAGMLLSNVPVRPGEHALEDLTVEILRRYGIEPGPGMDGHPVLQDGP